MRWPWTPPPAPPSRLTAQEACAVASSALAELGAPDAGRAASLASVDGALEWRVCTVAIGLGWVVRIADHDGAVIGAELKRLSHSPGGR